MSIPNNTESDKYYWHRYTDEYERLVFSKLYPQRIVEFGVFHGASIAELSRRFPTAEVIGIDILPTQAEWPRSPKIRYMQLDQGDRSKVAAVFQRIGDCDLVIEDGSHVPKHQANCLLEAWPCIRSKGWYVLEDLHTSHPKNLDWKHHTPPNQGNALHVVLAIEHLKTLHRQITPQIASSLSGFFDANEIVGLLETVRRVHIYRRALLPLKCYRCHESDFDYVLLRCRCGVDLYSETDSMTCLLQKV